MQICLVLKVQTKATLEQKIKKYKNKKLAIPYNKKNVTLHKKGVSQGLILVRTLFNAHDIGIFIYVIGFICIANYTQYPTKMMNRGGFCNPQLVVEYLVQMV